MVVGTTNPKVDGASLKGDVVVIEKTLQRKLGKGGRKAEGGGGRARERTREPLENQLKGGEFRNSERERRGRKRRKKEGDVQKKELVENVQREDRKPVYGEDERGRERKSKGERETVVPEQDKSWGNLEDGSFSFCFWSRIGYVSTLQQKDCRKRTEMLKRLQQQEVQVKERRWAEEIPQRWKQPKGEDRTEMKKEVKLVRVHFAKWIGVEYREEVHEERRRKNTISSSGLSTD